HPEEFAPTAQLLAEVRAGQKSEGVSVCRIRHKAGEYRWFEVRWAVRRDAKGELVGLHTAGRDVTSRLEAERQLNAYAEQLRKLSVRDELTGLYNRRGFMEAAERAYTQARRERRAVALIFVDLNDMKLINDQQGHEVGDQALVDAGLVLSQSLREADIVARLGGDEFVAFALDFHEQDEEPLRRRLRAAADQRVADQQRTFRLSMSVGGAYVSSQETAPPLGALLDQADAAMYERKTARRAAGGVSARPPGMAG
ncbi:MAG TPA: sensor domain-containing diguanylate cyclase, partial [Polyangiales bacterium]